MFQQHCGLGEARTSLATDGLVVRPSRRSSPVVRPDGPVLLPPGGHSLPRFSSAAVPLLPLAVLPLMAGTDGGWMLGPAGTGGPGAIAAACAATAAAADASPPTGPYPAGGRDDASSWASCMAECGK